MFKSNVVGVLLYGSEYGKIATIIDRNLEVLQNTWLICTRKTFWPITMQLSSQNSTTVENTEVEKHRATNRDLAAA